MQRAWRYSGALFALRADLPFASLKACCSDDCTGFLRVAGVRIGNYLGGDQLRVQAFEDRRIDRIKSNLLGGEAVAAAQAGKVW